MSAPWFGTASRATIWRGITSYYFALLWAFLAAYFRSWIGSMTSSTRRVSACTPNSPLQSTNDCLPELSNLVLPSISFHFSRSARTPCLFILHTPYACFHKYVQPLPWSVTVLNLRLSRTCGTLAPCVRSRACVLRDAFPRVRARSTRGDTLA